MKYNISVSNISDNMIIQYNKILTDEYIKSTKLLIHQKKSELQ